MNESCRELEWGELSDESFHFKQITWRVRNVSTLPENVDDKVQSPSFSFANATWKMCMYPNGQSKHQTQGYVDLRIVRVNSQIPEHIVFFKICFKAPFGKELESFSERVLIKPDNFTLLVIGFLEHSKFKKMKNVYAPNDVLTIVYEMRIEKIPAIHRDCQTESAASISDTKAFVDYKELFLKQEDCDVIIKVRGRQFPAHRTILVARSPVFASTFRNDMKEKSTGVMDIEDCDPSSFYDFLCFLYCGRVENLSKANVFSLFAAADKYDVQDLRSECLEFVKNNLSVDTFCDTVTLALQHFERELIALAVDFFGKNLQEIIVTVEWQSFLLNNTIQGNELLIKALASNKK